MDEVVWSFAIRNRGTLTDNLNATLSEFLVPPSYISCPAKLSSAPKSQSATAGDEVRLSKILVAD